MTHSISDAERRLVERAVELGRRGWGRVQPNPMVGCLIIRDGQVVGEGWHAEFGGPHAEIMALAEAGERARGATAYVSLEPCSHVGKTPPCSDALSLAGVERVVYGAADPGDDSGGGAAALNAAGVVTTGPVLDAREARCQNPGFFATALGVPWVAVKLALSSDGKIASSPGVRTPISGLESNQRVQWLRAGHDTILVGTNTALVDDPLLTVRGEVKPRIAPTRVILDASGRVKAQARVLREGDAPVRFLTSEASSAAWRREMNEAGASVNELRADPHGQIPLATALELLYAEGARTVLCEGGGLLASSLMEAGLADRLYLITAPIYIGREGVPAFAAGLGVDVSALSIESMHTIRAHSIHPDWMLAEEPRSFGGDLWTVWEPKGR